MKITLYMAMSLNGYIAEENGSEDFLSDTNWEKFCNLAQKHRNFIVGRKTYDAVKNWNEGFSFDDLKDIQKIVISQDENYILDDGYILATSPREAITILQDFESVLVIGGSAINTAFIKENLLDEVILNVEPTLIGKGIPLFAKDDFTKKLEYISSEISSDIVTLHYKVKK